jgi:hypothetical protein
MVCDHVFGFINEAAKQQTTGFGFLCPELPVSEKGCCSLLTDFKVPLGRSSKSQAATFAHTAHF